MKAAEFAHAIYELYPPFRQWEDATLKAWTSTVIGRCGGFEDKVREGAFKSLTNVKHKEKPPQVAVILEHCREVHRWIDAQNNKGKLALSGAARDPYLDDWRDDDFARAVNETELAADTDGVQRGLSRAGYRDGKQQRIASHLLMRIAQLEFVTTSGG